MLQDFYFYFYFITACFSVSYWKYSHLILIMMQLWCNDTLVAALNTVASQREGRRFNSVSSFWASVTCVCGCVSAERLCDKDRRQPAAAVWQTHLQLDALHGNSGAPSRLRCEHVQQPFIHSWYLYSLYCKRTGNLTAEECCFVFFPIKGHLKKKNRTWNMLHKQKQCEIFSV